MNEFSMFGKTCRIELIIIALLVGFIAGGYMLCGCMRFRNEGFKSAVNLNRTNGDVTSLNGQQKSINFWANNKSSPTCKSAWSTKDGQLCVTDEQIQYIKSRGGNSLCS